MTRYVRDRRGRFTRRHGLLWWLLAGPVVVPLVAYIGMLRLLLLPVTLTVQLIVGVVRRRRGRRPVIRAVARVQVGRGQPMT